MPFKEGRWGLSLFFFFFFGFKNTMIFWTTWIFPWRFPTGFWMHVDFSSFAKTCTLHTYAGPGRFTLGQRNAAGSTSATIGNWIITAPWRKRWLLQGFSNGSNNEDPVTKLADSNSNCGGVPSSSAVCTRCSGMQMQALLRWKGFGEMDLEQFDC